MSVEGVWGVCDSHSCNEKCQFTHSHSYHRFFGPVCREQPRGKSLVGWPPQFFPQLLPPHSDEKLHTYSIHSRIVSMPTLLLKWEPEKDVCAEGGLPNAGMWNDQDSLLHIPVQFLRSEQSRRKEEKCQQRGKRIAICLEWFNFITGRLFEDTHRIANL